MPAAWNEALTSLTQSSSSSSWLTKLRCKVTLGLVGCIAVSHEARENAMYQPSVQHKCPLQSMHKPCIGLVHAADE